MTTQETKPLWVLSEAKKMETKFALEAKKMETKFVIEALEKIANKFLSEANEEQDTHKRGYASGILFACGTIRQTLKL